MAGEPVAARRPRRRALWALLWLAAGLAELAVLAPVVLQRDSPIESVDVVLRLIGGSFAACGLIAWQRRPDSRVGLLMTATGFGSWSRRCCGTSTRRLAQTAGHWLADVWALFFVPLLLTTAPAAGCRTRIDWLLVGAVAVEVAAARAAVAGLRGPSRPRC